MLSPKLLEVLRIYWKIYRSARERDGSNSATELLPVEYFHVVFTLPQLLAPLGFRTSGWFTTCSFVPPPKLYCESPPTHDTWVPTSAFWRCCIPGDKTFIIIHTSTVSFPAAASHPARCQWIACRRQFFFRSSAQPSLPRQIRRLSESCFPRWNARLSW